MKASLELSDIAMDSIEVDQANVRKIILDEGIGELAQSINEIGLQQPVVVFRIEANKHSLIVGQRRYLACKELGWSKIPAIITKFESQAQAAIISFSENIHRTELDYRDKMRVAIKLLEEFHSVEKVAKKLGVSQPTVRNYMGYQAVPDELKSMVNDRKIGAITAIRITQNIPDQQKVIDIAKEVVKQTTSGHRNLIIDTAVQNPDKNVPQIVALTKRRKFTRILLTLTPRIASALETACKDYVGDPKDIVNQALEEWLGSKGFLR